MASGPALEQHFYIQSNGMFFSLLKLLSSSSHFLLWGGCNQNNVLGSGIDPSSWPLSRLIVFLHILLIAKDVKYR